MTLEIDSTTGPSARDTISTSATTATSGTTDSATISTSATTISTTSGGVDPQRRAVVIGIGLIGGSIALGLKRSGWHVSGIEVDTERLSNALKDGVVDAQGDDLEAEIIFVAVPVSRAAEVVRDCLVKPHRRSDVIVTDVCGVKSPIIESVDEPRFIGGHPMAGSEQIGLAGATADLFNGALWILTPNAQTDLGAFARLQAVIACLGADVVALSPLDHDRLVAVVSHVPHLVAATLMNTAAKTAEHDTVLLRLAAGGFRDMTRIAAGHPGIWPDICVENADAILNVIDAVLGDLKTLRDKVASSDRTSIFEILERASNARQALPASARRPQDLVVVRIPVMDREGVLAEITAIAAGVGINIYDIEIAHSAQSAQGVLMLLMERSGREVFGSALSASGYRFGIEELS